MSGTKIIQVKHLLSDRLCEIKKNYNGHNYEIIEILSGYVRNYLKTMIFQIQN